jgi:GTP cyclohydrolase II
MLKGPALNPAPTGAVSHSAVPLEVFARAKLPSRYGEFEIVAFHGGGSELKHIAVVRGDVKLQERVTARVHSECLTGDVLGSLRCDCRAQLEMALQRMGIEERAVLIYLRQEGRGIGLANKIRAYALQERGLDTFEANRHLGFDDDLRDYGDAAAMLRCLGVASVVLLTNNPKKIEGLRQSGIAVVGRLPLQTQPTVHNYRYLLTKKLKKGHLLDVGALFDE